MHQPDIELVDHRSRIEFFSELSEIFDREDLHNAMKELKVKEKLFKPGDQIIAQGDNFEKIIYVARGMVVEKNGDLAELLVPQLKFSKGMIAGLQNLLPNTEGEA